MFFFLQNDCVGNYYCPFSGVARVLKLFFFINLLNSSIKILVKFFGKKPPLNQWLKHVT